MDTLVGQRMRIAELGGKRVAIWGFGREGRAALAALREHHPAQLFTLFCTAAEVDAARAFDPALTVSGSEPDATTLAEFDVVVKSPGISAYKPALLAAQARGTTVSSGTALWFAEHSFEKQPDAHVIAVTGTKGKSTTSAMLAHLARSLGVRAALAGNIGLPAPGVELKLVPSEGKLEARLRGPHITPGYWREPALTQSAFDEEGFYKIGDAGKLVDDNDPAQGVAFDGRVAEDFKLSSGTWVSVGTLRPKIVSAMAPHVADVVITGHDKVEMGLLVFPTPQAKALGKEALRTHVLEAMQRIAAEGGGSSQCPAVALIQDSPPSADLGEITDKGYINQRAVLEHRAADVAVLYGKGDARVIRV